MIKRTFINIISAACLGLSVIGSVNAETGCNFPSGYYYDENLHNGHKELLSRSNPTKDLFAYLSTKDNIAHYRNEDKPKIFPDGEIILYLPKGIVEMTRGSNGYVIKPSDFMRLKGEILRLGYVDGYMVSDGSVETFNRVFNTNHKVSFVESENLGTILRENFSFAVMGVTTHKVNGSNKRYARAAAAIYLPVSKQLTLILISKKLKSDSVIENVHDSFQNAVTNISDCYNLPNGGRTFEKEYRGSEFKGVIEATPEPDNNQSKGSDDYLEKLRKIKSLLDDGIIDEEDFERMKQKIIDNM